MTAAAPVGLLAFDTSTERLAVALVGPHGIVVADEPGGALASAALIPCIERLLVQAGLAWPDVIAIAFGRGPGAFTGLRTSCAVAQGLTLGLSRPAITVDSLLIVAEDTRRQADPQAARFDVDVVMDARMGEVYAGRYVWADGRWHGAAEPLLCTPADRLARWQIDPPQWLAGSALAAMPGLDWTRAVPADRQRPTELSRPLALMALAAAAWSRGDTVDASLALPTYVRDKVALTTRERDAVRAAAAVAAGKGLS